MPGVVLVDRAIIFAEQLLGRPGCCWQVGKAKFFSPVEPGELLTFTLQGNTGGALAFFVRAGEREVAAGSLIAPAQ